MWPFNRPIYGYVEDSFDPRDVYLDEILGGDERDIPSEYHVDELVYDRQGVYPYCVPFATSSVIEYLHKRETNKEIKLSPRHLFYHAGGTPNGSSVRQNLNVAISRGVVSHETLPMHSDYMTKDRNWYQRERKAALSVPFKDPTFIKGYARVLPFSNGIKKAILDTGPLLIGVYVSRADGYYSGQGKRKTDDDNHCVALTGWDDRKNVWYIHESLGWVKENNGVGTLDQSYTFRYAFAITDLPEDWRQKRDEARNFAPTALEHYGKPRNYEREVEAANAILKRFKRFGNKSVTDAAGRFWHVYTNAVVYGGYSITDVVNDCYHWRRTGEHIFDFNQETREQWFNRIKGL